MPTASRKSACLPWPKLLRLGPALLLVIALSVSAQDPPVENEEKPEAEPASRSGKVKPGWFHLHDLDAFIQFDGSYEQSRVRSRDRDGFDNYRQTNRDLRLEETVGFQLDADIIDPALFHVQGEFEFGLTQSRFKEESSFGSFTDTDGGYLQNYDFRLDILSGKPVSGSVYGTRADERIGRRFLPSLREERTAWGTAWSFQSDTFPMRLTYDYRETDRTGNTDRFNDEHLTEEILRWEGDWLINENQTLRLSYEHGRSLQDYQGSNVDFDTRHDEIALDYEHRFGFEKQHDFQARFRYRPEQGDLARDILEINPQLTLRHSDSLTTRYRYQFYQEEYDNLSIDTHRADFQLIHQLYTNLTSTYHVFGLYEKTESDLETTQWGAGADFQYQRNNRFGRFRSHLSFDYDSLTFDGDDGLRFINNESGTFRDPLPITLSKQNVIPGSIVVTNASGTLVYRPLVDYVFTEVGDQVIISRVRGGRLSDGETVLIDYLYRTPTEGQLDTQWFTFGISQEFNNGFTPYYDLQFRHQDVARTSGVPLEEDRLERHRIGLRYRQDRWGASAEYEIHDDSILPYSAFHLRGDVNLLRKANHQFDASAAFSRFFFDGELDDRNVSLFDLNLDHRYTFRPGLAWRSSAAYRWEDDSRDGTTNGVDLETGVEYQWGELFVDLTAEYDLLNIEEDREDGFGVWLRVRRNIGNVLQRSSNWSAR